MSFYYREHGKPEKKKYKLHGRTKQSQKDETDINKLLERSAREKTLSHLEKYQANYADFSDYDFETHVKKIAAGNTMFEELPAETKREFKQSAQKFFEFVTNPENAARLPELLPQIARQGNYYPHVGVTPADLTPAETAPQAQGDAAGGSQGSKATEDTSPPALEDKPPQGG